MQTEPDKKVRRSFYLCGLFVSIDYLLIVFHLLIVLIAFFSKFSTA